jgi:hypothetical protein
MTPGTATNRSKLSAIWASEEWRVFVEKHTAGKSCEMCGKREGDTAINTEGEPYTVHLTVDHPFRWAYKSMELYLDFEASMCRVVCRTCNSLFEKGLDICPRCLKSYKQMREPICRECLFELHPEARAAFEAGQRDQKERQRARSRIKRDRANPHPCKHRGQLRRCLRKPGAVCDQNRKNAPKNGCGHYNPRREAVKYFDGSEISRNEQKEVRR